MAMGERVGDQLSYLGRDAANDSRGTHGPAAWPYTAFSNVVVNA